MSSINYETLGQDVFESVRELSKILDREVKPLLDTVDNNSRLRECSYLLFTRVWCWLRSLRKLDDPSDYQAMASCTRALLESTADIILLAHSVEPPEKMLGWTGSAHLRMAQLLINYLQESNLSIPSEYQQHQTFIQQNEPSIIQQRLSLWGRDRHPERWTGSGDLVTDLRRVGNLQEPLINNYLGMPLLEFYRGMFSVLSWGVHGSGLALTRNAALSPGGRDFYWFGASFHKFSVDLAIICTLSVLNTLGVSGQIPDLEQRLGQIRTNCFNAYSRF